MLPSLVAVYLLSVLRLTASTATDWTIITSDDFQTGWGHFTTIENSDDAKWDSEEGGRLVIGGNNGDDSSVFFSTTYDVAAFTDLRVAFVYHADGMEDDESFLLEYRDDPKHGTWQVVKRYIANVDFSNDNEKILSVVTLSHIGLFDLTEAVNIRFRCRASMSTDKIFLDDIVFQGLASEPTNATLLTLSPNATSTFQITPSSSEAPAIPFTPSPTFIVTPTNPMAAPPTATPSQTSMYIPNTSLEAVCPRNRIKNPEGFEIDPFLDSNPFDGVDDDLFEVSSMAYSDQLDSNGFHYAYLASDKEQYSLKVIRFTKNNAINGIQATNGQGMTVATYTLFTEEPLSADWEDISIGPCTNINTTAYKTDQKCIYIGNIGNNKRPHRPQRKNLHIYKFVEPIIGSNGPQDQQISFATIEFQYGTGFNQSEMVFYDGKRESLVLVVPR
jgi:hypothetical protein